MKQLKFILIFLFSLINLVIKNDIIITNALGSQFGENVIIYCLAKILTLKYNIPFYYQPFEYSDLFLLHTLEQKIENSKIKTKFIFNAKNDAEIKKLKKEFEKSIIEKYNFVSIEDEYEIFQQNFNKETVLYTNVLTKINFTNQDWINILKKDLSFKIQPTRFLFPENILTVAIHIRKGTGGGIYNDGVLFSQQEFNYDKSQIIYDENYNYYPFNWDTYERLPDGSIKDHNQNYYLKKNERNFDTQVRHQDLIWPTRCPPNQFYIDQLTKLSDYLKDCLLHVQIFTDDKDPLILVEKIKKNVNKNNITFHYQDNRNLSHKERIAQDLYNVAQCDILIRSQSFFAKVAELIGNHKIIIFPIDYKWENNKLIMTKIVFKTNI